MFESSTAERVPHAPPSARRGLLRPPGAGASIGRRRFCDHAAARADDVAAGIEPGLQEVCGLGPHPARLYARCGSRSASPAGPPPWRWPPVDHEIDGRAPAELPPRWCWWTRTLSGVVPASRRRPVDDGRPCVPTQISTPSPAAHGGRGIHRLHLRVVDVVGQILAGSRAPPRRWPRRRRPSLEPRPLRPLAPRDVPVEVLVGVDSRPRRRPSSSP